MPPPYPGINAQYAAGPQQPSQGAWGGNPPPQQNGGHPAWANPSFNGNQQAAGQPMSQAGLYPNLGPQQQPDFSYGPGTPYTNSQPGPYGQPPTYPDSQRGYPNAPPGSYPNVQPNLYPNVGGYPNQGTGYPGYPH